MPGFDMREFIAEVRAERPQRTHVSDPDLASLWIGDETHTGYQHPAIVFELLRRATHVGSYGTVKFDYIRSKLRPGVQVSELDDAERDAMMEGVRMFEAWDRERTRSKAKRGRRKLNA